MNEHLSVAAAGRVAEKAARLQSRFEHIARTRMAGLPMLHPGLAVRALGFEADAAAAGAWGVLLTPWFMNLVWFTLDEQAPGVSELRVGDSRRRVLGTASFDCIGAHEEGFGAFEACSLFSPMAEFVDQAAAVATAEAVLRQLRPLPAEPSGAARAQGQPAAPSRRALLFGRSAAAAGAGAP